MSLIRAGSRHMEALGNKFMLEAPTPNKKHSEQMWFFTFLFIKHFVLNLYFLLNKKFYLLPKVRLHFTICYVFERSHLWSSSMHLFDQKYRTNYNIVKL